MRVLGLILGFVGVCLLAAAPQAAQAQATRTWVSGVGDDVNPCSRTAPCKTFAGAISKTAAGGEIDVLDPGGFGTLTVTKAITIDGSPGSIGSVLASGTVGFTVNAATTDRVVLRNLSINGAGVTLGTNGINVIQAASVTLENDVIRNFSNNCVAANTAAKSQLVIVNSQLDNCTAGALSVSNAGGGFSRVDITGSSFQKSGYGISVGANSIVAVSTSLIANANGASGGGVLATGTSGTVYVQTSTIANNALFGVHASGGGVIYITQDMIIGTAGVGMQADSGSSIVTWANNYFANNTGGDGTATFTLTTK